MPKLPITKYSNIYQDLVDFAIKYFGRLTGPPASEFMEFFTTNRLVQLAEYFALIKIEQGNIPYPYSTTYDIAGGSCLVKNNPYWDAGQGQLNVDAVPANMPPTGIIRVNGEACYYYFKDGTHFFVQTSAGISGRNYPFGGAGSRHYLNETVLYGGAMGMLVGNHEFKISPPGSKKGGVFMPIILRYLAERFIKKTTTKSGDVPTVGGDDPNPGIPTPPETPYTPPGGGPGPGGPVDDPGFGGDGDDPDHRKDDPGLLMT